MLCGFIRVRCGLCDTKHGVFRITRCNVTEGGGFSPTPLPHIRSYIHIHRVHNTCTVRERVSSSAAHIEEGGLPRIPPQNNDKYLNSCPLDPPLYLLVLPTSNGFSVLKNLVDNTKLYSLINGTNLF